MKKRIQATHEQLFRHMANMIAERKRVTLAIAGTKKEPGFFYTIGNQEKQLPELLVIGNFKPNDMCALLNVISDKMIAAGAPYTEGFLDLGGEHPILLCSANEAVKEKYTIQAGQFYGNEDYDVLQVVIPDAKGCYPPDPKCHKDFQVPVLREINGKGRSSVSIQRLGVCGPWRIDDEDHDPPKLKWAWLPIRCYHSKKEFDEPIRAWRWACWEYVEWYEYTSQWSSTTGSRYEIRYYQLTEEAKDWLALFGKDEAIQKAKHHVIAGLMGAFVMTAFIFMYWAILQK